MFARMVPLDVDTIRTSVEKTGSLHDCPRSHALQRLRRGAGCATVQEECFYSLEAPVLRVTGWDTPVSARI